MRLATIDLRKAAYGQFALGAFNVSNMEQIHGLFRGASQADAPVIDHLKQLSRYSQAELMAAVVSGMFTAAITSERPTVIAPLEN